MDIGTLNQANASLSFGDNWNESARQHNDQVISKYNDTISQAKTTLSYKKGFGEAQEGVSGASAGLQTAKIVGQARNFDSDIAGFGKGKGVSGYFSPFTQGQVLKARFKQGQSKFQTALGGEGADVSSARAMNLKRTGTAMADRYSQPIRDASDPEVAKASAGVFKVGEAEETSVAGGFIKKGLKFATDMPTKQVGAIADIGGKSLGVFSGAKAIYDDTQGDWKKDTTLQKAGNVGDMIAGGLDALSVAIPVLAPVAAVASVVSAGVDVAGAEQSEKTQESTAGKTQSQGLTGYKVAPSLGSQGSIARQQVSAY